LKLREQRAAHGRAAFVVPDEVSIIGGEVGRGGEASVHKLALGSGLSEFADRVQISRIRLAMLAAATSFCACADASIGATWRIVAP